MNIRNNFLAVNSILIVISTTLIGTVLHELAHFSVAVYYGLRPELHHNYVNFSNTIATGLQTAIVAAAGPVFSLAFGTIVLLAAIKIGKISLFKLFMLWLGMNGILSFLGYILIAPIAKNGDTGKVFDFLNIPTAISFLIAFIALVIITKIFSRLSKEFRFYKSSDLFIQKENEKQLLLYPICSSILIVPILNLPVIHFLSLAPAIFLPMAFFGTMKAYRKLNLNDAELTINHVSKPLVIVTIISIVVFRILV